MNSVFSFVVGLLTAALSLLGFVQQHPELPQASRDQAQQIAQQAITQATNALSNQNTTVQTNTSAKFTATPTSGAAPLTVRFSQTATDDWRASIEYGDGATCTVDGTGEAANCPNKFAHTYTTPGTYTVKLWSSTGTDGASRPPLGTLTIKVSAGSNASQNVSATIDKNSLATNSSTPTITGTFSNFNLDALKNGGLYIVIVGGNSTLPSNSIPSSTAYIDTSDKNGNIQFTLASSGNFSAPVMTSLASGTYTVGIYGKNVYTPTDINNPSPIVVPPTLLATGTLTVGTAQNANNTTSPKVVRRGDNILVSWQASNPNADVYTALALVAADGSSDGILEGLPATGSYSFGVPTSGGANMAFGHDLVVGKTYHIRITSYHQLCKESCGSSPTKLVISTRDDYYFTLDSSQN